MNASKWFMLVTAIIILVTVLIGFAYLQNEINGLRSPNSPSPTPSPPSPTPSPTSTATPEPQPTPTPEPVTPPAFTITTATYGGTTLVCNCSLELGNDGGPILVIKSLNITNIGNATAYNVNLRIQTYFPNGTLAADVTHKLDASGLYSPFPTPPYEPYNMLPGYSYSGIINGRPGSYQVYGLPSYAYNNNSILANYTVTPVWSSTPVD